MADACARAARGRPATRAGATAIELAVGWFVGDNDVGVVMWDPRTGGGYDGLQADRPQPQPGAESTLALIATLQHARQLQPTVVVMTDRLVRRDPLRLAPDAVPRDRPAVRARPRPGRRERRAGVRRRRTRPRPRRRRGDRHARRPSPRASAGATATSPARSATTPSASPTGSLRAPSSPPSAGCCSVRRSPTSTPSRPPRCATRPPSPAPDQIGRPAR